MVYSIWLLGFSLLFVAVERLRPRTDQPIFRRGIWSDIAYIVFNSHYLGLLLGLASIHLIAQLDRTLDLVHLRQRFYMGIMSGQSLWVQIPLLLLIFDFAQWCIHNLLHRIPVLWEFHKVHHSIEQMDWIGNWRFHGFEVVFYQSLLYPLAAFFGFSGPAMFWYGVTNTLIGHFAHANCGVHIGALKYVVNSPEMHIWHHTHPDSGPMNKNFGIALSVWDWLFGTAYVPANRDPKRLGFARIEEYPRTIVGQTIAPGLAAFQAAHRLGDLFARRSR